VNIPPFAWFIVAALADFTLVFTHGVVGHPAFLMRLTRDRLFPTRSWGDEDMGWRVFAVSWHIGTAVFGFSGVALLLLATGVLEGHSLPLFISALHGAFFLLGVSIMGPRLLAALRRPIPISVAICFPTVCVASWLGTR
jgi:hypothetical protein